MNRVFIWLFRLALTIDSAWLAARTLSVLTRPVNNGGSVRVLCLKKTVFWDDLLSMASRGGPIQYLEFPRLLLSDVVRKYTDRFDDLNDSSYYPIMDGTLGKERIYRFMHTLIPLLKKTIGFDAVLAGNYVYVSQQEFFRALQAHGIPVMVLYKEGIGAAVSMNATIRRRMYSTKRFYADRILFYNSHIRDALVEAEVPGLTAEKTAVVGIPRFDRYVRVRSVSRPKRIQKLVHFSFETLVKSDRFMHDDPEQHAYEKRLDEYQRAILRLVATFPTLDVVVKTKGSIAAQAEMARLLEEERIPPGSPNLTIQATGDVGTLIQEADVVSGYLSTSLLEALVVGRSVMTPKMSDIASSQPIDFFSEADGCVNHVADLETMIALLNNPERLVQPSTETISRILEPFIYSMDGESCARTEAEIFSCLASRTSP